MNFVTFTLTYGAVGLLVWIISSRLRARKGAPLPPGPPADPFFGHLRVIPSTGQATTFYEWSKTYGDVIHLHSFGRSIIVLNSVEAATELLDKRGANYSDRPRMLIVELMGWWPTLAFLPYGKLFMKHRRVLQNHFGPQKALSHLPIQTRQAHILAKNMMVEHEENTEHTRHLSRYAKAIVLEAAFGQRVESDQDQLMKMGNEVSHSLNNAGPIGSTPVDFIPWMKYLPGWFPGAYYGGRAKAVYAMTRRFHDYPMELLQQQMAEGTANPCIALAELERPRPGGIDDDEMTLIKGVSAAIYAGGADTVFTTIHMFLLSMLQNPDVLKKAQQEIDTVIGHDRLPEYSDRPSLPYVEAVMQETLRWQPVVDLGIPHRCMEDDVYNGMFIPKGATVMANSRAMTWDEKVYSDPPEGREEPHPTVVWGWGRRICPGRHLAHATLWMCVATVIGTLDISPVNGADGKPYIPKVEFTTGLTQEQVPFPCIIKARSERVKSLILSTCAAEASA
ncbi:cytochrome P450 [Mycena rosella]|uniref:Cytochrome P450 n=1 Tax=Mycena rosella TaxID=1033263 RepID=A0AAD7AWL9_MYCRO|nr:cytochrome P450 [Mycena rosella]